MASANRWTGFARTGLTRVLFASLALLPAEAAAAQPAFPTRQITIVVPFAAGGPSDAMARYYDCVRNCGAPVFVSLHIDFADSLQSEGASGTGPRPPTRTNGTVVPLG